jgi:hypothetical protein
LTDLQRQLNELQQENVRLNEEKTLMFESLCRQTERLNESRNDVESLKHILYKDESGQFESAAEREQKLVDLLKSAQEERETLLMKQEQLGNDLEDSRSENLRHNDDIVQLKERVTTLESTLDAKHAEHKLLDQELAQAKDQSSSRQIEINRLKDLLENARTKINELEQDRTLSDKSELDELLDNARKEKDALESEVAHLKEQLALSKNETEKLKEQVSILQEECKVTRNNAKTTQSDLEYKLEKVQGEKNALTEQLQQFQEAVNELQVQAQCQLDDKRQLSTVLSETQRNLNESEQKIADLENELSELKKTKQEQEEEWEKFQNDLLTSVRVANDFKTEAQQDLQKLIMENKAGRERIKQLEAQIDKLKGGSRRASTKKRLSKEAMLMASLDRRYKAIENLSDDQLTEEQRAVKVLKMHYDGNTPRQKPVARKPKSKLAISKPSLESVISNPKLEKIVGDAAVPNVERASFFSDDEDNRKSLWTPTRSSLLDDLGPSIDEVIASRKSAARAQSDAGLPPPQPQVELRRSRSVNDLSGEEEPSLRRYDSTDNLLALNKKEKKLRKKSTVNFDTLERICREIDPNTPEDQLTKEQRMALRMREFLSTSERKATLKKNPKLRRKKVLITRPTKESVEKNVKLRQIMNDPIMRSVVPEASKVVKRSKVLKKGDKERHSMPVALQPKKTNLKPTKSKSYNDISFKFQSINMYSEQDGKHFDAEVVLPPEDFRDPPASMVEDNSTFKTFQINNNTFKREHNYLEGDEQNPEESAEKFGDDSGQDEDDYVVIDLTEEAEGGRQNFGYYDDRNQKIGDFDSSSEKDKEFVDYSHGGGGREMIEANHYFDDQIEELYIDPKRNKPDGFEEDRRGDFDYFDDSGFVGDQKMTVDDQQDFDYCAVTSFVDSDDRGVAETLNDVVKRQLDYDDNVIYNFDEEERKDRRGSRQRYSRVIEEMKVKFDDEEHDQSEDKDESTKARLDNLVKEDGLEEGGGERESESEFKRVPSIKINDLDFDERILELAPDRGPLSEACDETDEAVAKGVEDVEVDGTICKGGIKNYESEEIEEMSTKQREEPSLRQTEELTTKTQETETPRLEEEIKAAEDLETVEMPVLDDVGIEKSDKDDNFQTLYEELDFKRTLESPDLIQHVDKSSNIASDEEEYENHKRQYYKVKEFEDSDFLKEGIKVQDNHGDILAPPKIFAVEEKSEELDLLPVEKKSVPGVHSKEEVVLLPVERNTLVEIDLPQAGNSTCEEVTKEELDLLPVERNASEEMDLLSFGKRTSEKRTNEDLNLSPVEQKTEEIDLLQGNMLEEVTKEELELSPVERNTPEEMDFLQGRKSTSDELTKEELELLQRYSRRYSSRTLSEIKQEDLALVESLKEHYKKEDDVKEQIHEQRHVYPRILSPTRLNQPTSYEPVYANFYVSSNRAAKEITSPVSGKKPIALPRMHSIDCSSNESIYEEFGGQVRKTRFSITYERKKGDTFKEHNQEKTTKVKDLKNMFEKKSKSDFSGLVSRALEDD